MYLIEQFKWTGKEYYSIVASRIIDTDKELPEKSWHKNGSYFTITKLDDEVQTTRRRKPKERGNV